MSVISGIAGAITAGNAADTAAEAQNNATATSKQSQDEALALQKQMYDQTRADFQPYQNLGYSALPKYREMLGLPAVNNSPSTPQTSAIQGIFNTAFTNSNAASGNTGSSAQDLSPLGQWQLQEFNKNQNRQDAARGLSGSGGASARLGEGAMNIAGQDYAASYARILDALKIGTGASSSAGGASSTYGNAVSNAANANSASAQSAANNLGNIVMDNGQTQANLWGGMSSNAMNGYNTYLKADQAGMFGSGSTGTTAATGLGTYAAAGNTAAAGEAGTYWGAGGGSSYLSLI